MIEIVQKIKYILVHPENRSTIEIIFSNEKSMDDWLPYLNKFEDSLIREAIKATKPQ